MLNQKICKHQHLTITKENASCKNCGARIGNLMQWAEEHQNIKGKTAFCMKMEEENEENHG